MPTETSTTALGDEVNDLERRAVALGDDPAEQLAAGAAYASLQRELGQRALRHVSRSANLSPELPNLKALVAILTQVGQLRTARDLLQKIALVAPSDPDLKTMLDDLETRGLGGGLVADLTEFRGTLPDGRACLIVPIEYPPAAPTPAATAPFDFLMDRFARLLPAMLAFLETLKPRMNPAGIPDERTDDRTPFWNNGYFSGTDARVAYALAQTYRPSRIIEIGSGNSTKFFRRAIDEARLGTRLISIDPTPRAEITGIADEVHRAPLQEAPLTLFTQLRPGDILFYDGSHLTFQGGDVAHFFLRVLPVVPPGVFVHVHDITLPFEYPREFWGRHYSEQYVLGAFLVANAQWEVLLPLNYLARSGHVPDGVSFWMRRAATLA